MKKERKAMSIVRKMLISVLAGFVVGFLCLFLKIQLINSGKSQIWEIINQIFFQDITVKEGINGIGLFFIIGNIFMSALQLGIVPLVLVSLSLAMCSIAQGNKLGKIAGKTILCFVIFYFVGAALAGTIAYTVKSYGLFNVSIPAVSLENSVTMEPYNPLTVIINAVPNNLASAFSSNNQILSVVVVAIVIGLCMQKIPEKTKSLREFLQAVYDIIQLYLDFLINKIAPVAIFCMIARTFAIYGVEYLRPIAAFVITGVLTGIFLVITIYPIGIFITTGLSPWKFMKKIWKVGLFAAATNSSAATLPLNIRTCTEELGCSKEITSFVLPTGMTINMNGTTVMHMIATTFIATSAGIDITPSQLVMAALISVTTAMGCPAIPVAGTTMIFAVLSGLGFTSDACMIGYALVLAMNYPVGMAVITMNVVGDAATNVIVCAQEGELDRDIFNDNLRIAENN